MQFFIEENKKYNAFALSDTFADIYDRGASLRETKTDVIESHHVMKLERRKALLTTSSALSKTIVRLLSL